MQTQSIQPQTPPAKRRSFVIGVAGGSGSGKSTVARNLIKAITPDEIAYLQQDCYYHDLRHLSYEERCDVNFDHPGSLDDDLLLAHLDQLAQGQAIDRPIYDFSNHARLPESERVEAHRVVVVEGILVFAHPLLRERMDIKVFVDTDPDIRIIRRMLRDVSERGRSVDSIIAQYLKTVRPMHNEFVEPSKRFADIVIPEGGNNKVALDMLIAKVRSVLAS